MKNSSALLLVALLLTNACKTGPGRQRRPLLDFSGSKPNKPTQRVPPRMLMGQEAQQYIDGNRGGAVRMGSNQPKSSMDFESNEEMLLALERASASERPILLERLFELGRSEVRDLLEQRRRQLRFNDDLYADLLARIASTDEPRLARRRASEPVFDPATQSSELGFLQERYRLAVDRFLAGDYLGALRLADALAELAPDSALIPKVRRLRQSSRERLLRETVLYTELFAPEYLTSNKTLTLRLRLTNRSEENLVIVPPERDEPVMGALEVSYEELFPDGTRSRNQVAVQIREAKTLSLKPENKVDIDIPIPSVHRKKRRGVLGRYVIQGYLRPFELRRGRENLPYLLPLFPVRLHVVDRRDLALVRDPLASLEDSLEALDNVLHFLDPKKRMQRFRPDKSPKLDELLRRCFVTAVLAGEHQREPTLDFIAGKLPKTPPRVTRTLCAALSRIVGDPFNYTREEWLDWFVRRRQSPGARPVKRPAQQRDDGEEPGAGASLSGSSAPAEGEK